MTTQTCPRCRRVFRVPPDEEGQHPCPGCGYEPGMRLDDCRPGCPGGNCDCDVELVDDEDATWVE
jgi:hypothetical protein